MSDISMTRRRQLDPRLPITFLCNYTNFVLNTLHEALEYLVSSKIGCLELKCWKGCWDRLDNDSHYQAT